MKRDPINKAFVSIAMFIGTENRKKIISKTRLIILTPLNSTFM